MSQEQEVLKVSKYARISPLESWNLPYLIFLQYLRNALYEEEEAIDRRMEAIDYLSGQVTVRLMDGTKWKPYHQHKKDAKNKLVERSEELTVEEEKEQFARIMMAFDGAVDESLL